MHFIVEIQLLCEKIKYAVQLISAPKDIVDLNLRNDCIPRQDLYSLTHHEQCNENRPVYDANHRVEPAYIYSRLSLSRIPRDPLKYFGMSVLRHIRFAELKKK